MKEVLNADQSVLLMDLWRRRHKLNTAEIGLMYDIVQRCLQQSNPPELQLLGETRQELVAQFIYCKVLRLQDRDGSGNEDLVEDDDGHSAPSRKSLTTKQVSGTSNALNNSPPISA